MVTPFLPLPGCDVVLLGEGGKVRILRRRYALFVSQNSILKCGVYEDFTAMEGFQYILQCSVGIREAPVFLDSVPFVSGMVFAVAIKRGS